MDDNPIVRLFKVVSLYLPIILVFSLLIVSMLSGSLQKFTFYTFAMLPLIIFLRIIVFRMSGANIPNNDPPLPVACSEGLINTFNPEDILFGTYLLSFTLFYFLTPMILLTIDSDVDSINYLVILFFMCYIFLDLAMKKQMGCLAKITTVGIVGNFFSGTLLGSGLSALIYSSPVRNLLFVNELNSNKEVCTVPNKQQFKCRVYKNGELVGSTST
jgi:hypothetical protein